jgi:arylsulfatase A-like enzyme
MPTSNRPPNILFVSTDQQRFDTVLPYRPDFLRVPHLDSLSRRGISFRRAYSTCPICVPARCTVMSGQHEWTHGMTNNGESSAALNGRRTMPDRLRELGYQTMAIGKMHFGPRRARHGFDDCLIADDYFLDLKRRGEPFHEFHHGLGQNEWYPGMSSVPEPLTYTSWTAEKCVEFLHHRRDPDRPFFMWCSFGKPHPPFDPPEPYYSMYRNRPLTEPVIGDWASDPDKRPYAIHANQLGLGNPEQLAAINPDIRAAYYGLITQIDYNLGRVLGALSESCAGQETMIIFTSDHGELLGDHGLYGKCQWLESSAHVPMIVVPPPSMSGWTKGQRRNELVCLADVLPTCVGLGGGEANDVEGMDILAMCRGETEPRTHLEGIGPGPWNQSYRALTDGRWKYIWYVHGPSELLFDLETDPYEQHNLAHEPEHRERCEDMHRLLVDRIAARPDADGAIENGRLTSITNPPPLDDAAQRAGQHVGYHTEYVQADVFH